jgi:hypothetical protein
MEIPTQIVEALIDEEDVFFMEKEDGEPRMRVDYCSMIKLDGKE